MSANVQELIQGLGACSLDHDCKPQCIKCPYSIGGEKWENNRTSVRCCDVLKSSVLSYLKECTKKENSNVT